MLELKNIRKDYVTSSETVNALKGVSISFRSSEFVSILGPSGCGKTTMLNIIGGLDHYTDGDLVIGGRSTKSYTDRDWDVYRNHRVGFIFQSYNLIPHQTVLGNVELALTIAGIEKEERVERAKRALDRVGLSGQYYKRPNQLSGGQCQRVAIARALVNDPEILLADEPTGALDTVTSVQIMDLIKEISGERLVIMVTHNPELAEKYSSRIVRLLDGNIIEDTNPMTEAESERELAELHSKEEAELRELEECTPAERKQRMKERKRRREKAKMSFFTAFMLSARNLLSKKGRTAMVGFAGSIGIIGIAMVLAFSAGIKGYVAAMQDDMLSGNPIEIAEVGYDLSALTDMMNESKDALEGATDKKTGHVYVSSLVEYLAKMGDVRESVMMQNTITEAYINYVKAMPREYYNAMLFDYGIDLNANLYTDFYRDGDSEPENISVSALTAIYTSILKETEFSDYSSYVGTLAPSFAQMPNNPDYILSQYDLVSGTLATEANQVVLVLDSNEELSDLLLARFGFYTQEQFLEIVYKATEDPDFDKDSYKDSFAYDELIGKTLTWYPNDTVFTKTSVDMGGFSFDRFAYNYRSDGFDATDALELEVVGILTTKENVNYGSLTSGIYYTPALTDYILTANEGSEIFDYIEGIDETNTDTATAMLSYYFTYTYEYTYAPKGEVAETKTAYGSVGPTMTMSDMMSSMTGGGTDSAFDHKEMKTRLTRNLGGNPVASAVYIYPVSFDDKDLVTDYLSAWNEEGDITVDGVTYTLEERGGEVTYTDALELIINMVNTMIDVISYALIAFTSISLVVSTVMIGIITYVSVVERIKEIGVIRSLGGRKKDVSHLFNAETFIIGLLAGLFGIGVTYLISVIVNLILKPLINYSSIAALPVSQAILLVLLSVGLTLISGLIPASSAAKKDPVVALRTE